MLSRRSTAPEKELIRKSRSGVTLSRAALANGPPSVTVHVTSGIEPSGENVTLSRSGPDERWRGSIATAFGTATPDGVLQVREGDAITAIYQDAAPPHTSTASLRDSAMP